LKEKFEIDYDEKTLPKILQNTKKDVSPKKVEFEIMEIKKVILPKFDEAKLKELFANENITNEKELEKKIEEVLKQQKEE
jgi:Fe-S-cluster formation regulator IscX/YfhJ